MNIRESNNDDLNSIRLLHEHAFGEPEGKAIGQLACDILSDETAKPLLSLVVENEKNEEIIGHIIFSSVKIEGSEELSTYILAPLAIARKFQHKGWGTKLINYGLAALKAREAFIVLVLGDPNYYGRVGFKTNHNVKAPYKLEYPEAWMALELKSGMLAKAKGVAQCAFSLASPEHW